MRQFIHRNMRRMESDVMYYVYEAATTPQQMRLIGEIQFQSVFVSRSFDYCFRCGQQENVSLRAIASTLLTLLFVNNFFPYIYRRPTATTTITFPWIPKRTHILFNTPQYTLYTYCHTFAYAIFVYQLSIIFYAKLFFSLSTSALLIRFFFLLLLRRLVVVAAA